MHKIKDQMAIDKADEEFMKEKEKIACVETRALAKKRALLARDPNNLLVEAACALVNTRKMTRTMSSESGKSIHVLSKSSTLGSGHTAGDTPEEKIWEGMASAESKAMDSRLISWLEGDGDLIYNLIDKFTKPPTKPKVTEYSKGRDEVLESSTQPKTYL